MSKRTNFIDMEKILVGSGDQALATGTLVGAGNALSIADGQLGVMSVDHDSTVQPYGDFLVAGDDAAEVRAIRIIQGTSASANINTADAGFQAATPAYEQSGVIKANQVRSIAAMACKVPHNSNNVVHTFTATPGDLKLYASFLKLISTRGDRDYGDNQEVMYTSFTTPDYTNLGLTDDLDHLLNNLLFRMNQQSRLVRLPNTSYGFGNRDFVAFGIDIDGLGGGTVIGTMVAGDTFDVISCNGQTFSYTADSAFINTLNKAIACGPITATSTIQVIDLDTAGDGTTAMDAFMVMGLDAQLALAYDDIEQVKTRVEINMAESFLTDATVPTVECCDITEPLEGTGQGRKWYIEYGNRARMHKYTPQVFPNGGDWIVEPPSYIDPTLDYTSYIIDYFDNEETITDQQNTSKQLIILLPCSITLPASTAATGYVTATDDTTTVADLNAILGAWMSSQNRLPEYYAESTQATPFV